MASGADKNRQENRRGRRVWVMLLVSVKDFFHDQGPKWAAAIAYYSLLSAFPLMLAAASIAAYFVEPEWAVEQLSQILQQFLPEATERVESIVESAVEARAAAGVLSFAGLLWTGTRVFGAMTVALNIAAGAEEHYGPIKRFGIEILMLLTLGVIFVLAFAGQLTIGFLWQMLGREAGTLSYAVVNQVLPIALLFLAFFLSYRFVPRRRTDWQAALMGSSVAIILFLLARFLFLYYVRRLGDYDVIYGSLGIAVVLLIWAWIVANILILGGEVTSHTQEMLIEGKPAEEVERGHLVRSPFGRFFPDREKVSRGDGNHDAPPRTEKEESEQASLTTDA
jgi:membrane protein